MRSPTDPNPTDSNPTHPERPALVHLRAGAGNVSLVLDLRGPRLPRVLHWGADLGPLTADELEAMALASVAPVVSNVLDEPVAFGLLPEHATGWQGRPGLVGHRQGRHWSPLFAVSSAEVRHEPDGGALVTVYAQDPSAALALRLELVLDTGGLLRMRAAVRNDALDSVYDLDGLQLCLPVPSEAVELLDFTGRHLRERSPQRQPFTVGSRVRENRRGRTGPDATLLLLAGTSGFGFADGEVWGVHVAWSGNHRSVAERLASGHAVLGGGELLLPGEVRLAPGEEFCGAWLVAAYGRGLDDVAASVHTYLRGRPRHPRSPRPVVLNTWEAVYFDHDLDKLNQLARLGAEVGVERFVLDDGWFRNRRDDRRGLGDWYVDESIWPDGLHPLVNVVRGLGMQFGLWVEPEMVSPDSDLARAHPEWILSTGGRTPPSARFQQVLDLCQGKAFDYVFDRLDALVGEYRIDYLKWDHNRDLVDAGHSPGGEAAVRRQTLAAYELMDRLRANHPGLEIESCSSGGARVDLGILERVVRVWASDCIDSLERQSIQRWTGQLVPPEMIGAHIGADRAHTTGRRHDLAFRAGTALFGHLGIEWDLTRADPEQRAELARWVGLYKNLRHLLHTGRVTRADHPDPALWVHGVVAQDRSEAVFAVVGMATSVTAPPGRVRFPGLDPDGRYLIEPLPPGDRPGATDLVAVAWLADARFTLTGRVIGQVGIQMPDLHPEQLFLLQMTRERR
jgi:alpha-galactosidase